MYRKTLALSVLFLAILFIATSCKKSSSTPVANGNSPKPLSNAFYFRGLLDTTWQYQGNDNGDECQTTGSVCSSFLIFYNNNIYAAKFDLTDSANPRPKDSVIRSWVGKTFVTAGDNTASHAYLFRFEYPDAIGRAMSTDYVINNTGAKLTVDSVVYDGLSKYYADSLGSPFKSYRVKGSINCKITHFGDSVIHNVTQGVYSVNVIEAK